MKINLEQLKTLAETGDVSALEQHILTQVLEKGDLAAAVKANKDIESERDQQLSNSLQTWKDNHLEKLVAEEVAKRNPSESPEQKQIRELQERLDAKDKETQREKLRTQALKHVSAQGFDMDFAAKYVDKFLAEDEVTTKAALDEFKKDFDTLNQKVLEDKLKGSQRNPSGGASGGQAESYGKKLAQMNKTGADTAEAQAHYFK